MIFKTLIAGLSFLISAPAFADCVDLSEGNVFTFTRHKPFFQVTNTIHSDGSHTEERSNIQDGVRKEKTTKYWNGVIAVDLQTKPNGARVHLKLDDAATAADLTKVNQAYSYPMTLWVNDKQADSGRFEIETREKTRLMIGGCPYDIMVVRTTMHRKNGTPINQEALYSLDARIPIGSVAMTPDWTPKHGVFFDSIEKN